MFTPLQNITFNRYEVKDCHLYKKIFFAKEHDNQTCASEDSNVCSKNQGVSYLADL